MAVVTGTVQSVSNYVTPAGFQDSGDATPQQVLGCFISVDFAGTYAQADNALIANVDVAIESARRNGKSVTLLGAAPASPGLEGTNKYVIYDCTISGGVSIDGTMSDATLVAEHGNALLGTANRPCTLFVSFKE